MKALRNHIRFWPKAVIRLPALYCLPHIHRSENGASSRNANTPIPDQPRERDRHNRVAGIAGARAGAARRRPFRWPRPETRLRLQGRNERRGDRGLHRVSGSLLLRRRFRRRRPAGGRLFRSGFPSQGAASGADRQVSPKWCTLCTATSI